MMPGISGDASWLCRISASPSARTTTGIGSASTPRQPRRTQRVENDEQVMHGRGRRVVAEQSRVELGQLLVEQRAPRGAAAPPVP